MAARKFFHELQKPFIINIPRFGSTAFQLKATPPSRQPLLECEAFRSTQPSFWETSPAFFHSQDRFQRFGLVVRFALSIYVHGNFLDDFRLCKFFLNGRCRKNYRLDFPGSTFVNIFPQVAPLFSSSEFSYLVKRSQEKISSMSATPNGKFNRLNFTWTSLIKSSSDKRCQQCW